MTDRYNTALASANVATPLTKLAAVSDDISAVGKGLEELTARAQVLADRLGGSEPPAKETSGATPQPVPNGMAAQLGEQVRYLSYVAGKLGEQLGRLERL